MRTVIVAVATLASVALPGCLVGGRSSGEVTVGATVEVGHDYTYFPSQHAYWCETCGEWWVLDGGLWVSSRSRPRSVVVTQETPWVKVDVRGALPYVGFEAHSRDYPAEWKSRESHGPPPGRGWRK